MTSTLKNDVYYVCSLIEYTARKTNNKRSYITNKLGKEGIYHQLYCASVNHCLSFEQVSDRLINNFGIENGDFDTISECDCTVPDYLSIGKLYSYIIQDIYKEPNTTSLFSDNCDDEDIDESLIDLIINVFNSIISIYISNFHCGFYYENLSYIEACYKQNRILV